MHDPAPSEDADASFRRRVEALFQQALALPEPERASFLQRGDVSAALRDEVRSLLDVVDDADAFFESPWHSTSSRSLLDDAIDAVVPPDSLAVPSYRIVRQIGRGGMGTVYLAERADGLFERPVALKVVRRGLDTDDILNRFVSERQILASLDHPNIARLLDGGTTDDGRPFFVMEYIDGEPITQYCDRNQLSITDRLLLFRTVCDALHYAHQHLVVHRDLKPSNILVTADGTVKLLDFGIAKLLDATAEAPMTRTGLRLLTPEYAAPEQIKGRQVTTATDVYAFGVLLYELLSGRRPYALESRLQTEMERIICEEEPARPSTAVTTADAPTTGRTRSTSTERLRRRLQGDLDTIVMMALRKEPERRYRSVEQLSEDVRRHLEGLPVLARPDTIRYRSAKFVRRHRWSVAGVTGVTLVLVTLVATLLVQQARTARALDRAEHVSAFLVRLFEVNDPGTARGNTITAREILDRSAAQIDENLVREPGTRAEMRGILGRIYSQLGLYREAEPLLARAVDEQRSLEDFAGTLALARTANDLAELYLHTGQPEKAEPLLREALALRQRSLGTAHADVAAVMDNLAYLQFMQGHYDEAEELQRNVLSIRRGLSPVPHLDLGQSLNNLGMLLRTRGRYEEAESLYREALAVYEQALGPDHPEVAITLNNLGVLLHAQGDAEAAVPYLRRSLALRQKLYGTANPKVTAALCNLGNALRDLGHFDEAERHIRRALAIDREALGEQHPHAVKDLYDLAELHHAAGTLDVAADEYREALGLYRATVGPEHPDTALPLEGLGRLLLGRGQPAAAEPLLRDALSVRRRALGADAWQTAYAEALLGATLLQQGRLDEARPLLQRGYDRLVSVRGSGHPKTREILPYVTTMREHLEAPSPLTTGRTVPDSSRAR